MLSPRPYLCISRSIRLLGKEGRLEVLMLQPLANGRQTHSAVNDFRCSTVSPFVIYSLRPLSSNPCRIATICTTTLSSYAADHSKGCQFP